MKLVSWNVNGIRAVWTKGLFQKAIEQLEPDILCLQETKAEQHQSPVDLPQYIEFYNSAVKKGYSGTAIFSKTQPLSVTYNFPPEIAEKSELDDGFGRTNEEGRVIAAEFPDFHVVTVYTPNSKGDLERLPLRHKHWDPAFLEYVRLLEKTKPVIFCGDLNVAHTEDDLANPKPNVGEHGFTDEEREGFGNFLKAGFVDTFRMFTQGNGHYTWWTQWSKARERNVGWRIDYFLVSEKLKDRIKKASIHADVMGSDHCPVSIELQ